MRFAEHAMYSNLERTAPGVLVSTGVLGRVLAFLIIHKGASALESMELEL